MRESSTGKIGTWVAVWALASAGGAAALAAPFTAGNLAVFRAGVANDGTNPGNTADSVFIDEYTPAGTLVQSIAVPDTGAARLTVQGSATLEGMINLTTNGRHLVFAGYDAALGTSTPATATAAAVNRVVGRIDSNGVIDTSTRLSDWSDSQSPRSVISSNGTSFFLAGGQGGVRQAPLGASTSTSVSTTIDNLRHVDLFGGQLFASTATTGANGVQHVNTSTGVMTGLTGVPGGTTSADTVQFFMADLSATIDGVDTLYVTDARSQANGGGLRKYSLQNDGTWTASGSIAGAQPTGAPAVSVLRGLTGTVSGSTVTLYGIRNTNQLLGFVDTTGYNGTLTGTATLLATAPTNTLFKGLDFVPVPEPSSLGALALCGLLALRRRRHGTGASGSTIS